MTKAIELEIEINKKTKVSEKKILSDVIDIALIKYDFSKVHAKEITFRNVNFSHSEFVDCYFRKCKFIQCNFTGCIFKSSNFRGTKFEGCQFRFANWEKTFLEDGFLDSCMPPEENIAREIARSLRINYNQLGNYIASNRAATSEINATIIHYKKSAYSSESFYRDNIKGLDRFRYGVLHAQWVALHYIWGNGESVSRVVYCILAILLFYTGYFRAFVFDSWEVSFKAVACSFVGVPTENILPALFNIQLASLKIILFGLFMAVLIKRTSRR